MPRPIRSLLAALPLLALACAAPTDEETSGETSDALASPGDRLAVGVDVKERGEHVSHGIPIEKDKDHADPRIIYSVPLANLDPKEQLRIAGLVTLSRCNYSDLPSGDGEGRGELHSPCEALKSSSLYQYAPHVEARLYLGSSPGDAKGHALTDWEGYQCSFDDHHCPVVLSANASKLSSSAGKPLYVNLAVRAWHGDARNGDLVEVKGECKNGDYDPKGGGVCEPMPADDDDAQKTSTHGQLTVERIGPGITVDKKDVDKLDRHTIPVQLDGQDRPTVVLLSVAIQDVKEGDVVDVRSMLHMKSDPSRTFHFDHFLGTAWILSDDAKDVKPQGKAGRWVSADNGQNCDGGHCRVPQTGAVQIPKGVKGTVHLNLVGRASDSGPSSVHAAAVVDGKPDVSIRCYSAPRSAGEGRCKVSP